MSFLFLRGLTPFNSILLFLKIPKSQPVPNVIAWIERNLQVDKTRTQHFMRNLRGIGAYSFLYRFA